LLRHRSLAAIRRLGNGVVAVPGDWPDETPAFSATALRQFCNSLTTAGRPRGVGIRAFDAAE
jgi:hypothetical protein